MRRLPGALNRRDSTEGTVSCWWSLPVSTSIAHDRTLLCFACLLRAAKELTVLRDLLCDVQSVCEPSQLRAAENVAAAFVTYPFDTPHISRVLTTDMLTNRTQARLAMEDEIKAVEEEAESFVSNLKSGMFRCGVLCFVFSLVCCWDGRRHAHSFAPQKFHTVMSRQL